MGITRWQRRKRQTLLQAKIFAAHRDRLCDPRDGREFDFFVMEAPDWVNVIALTAREQVVLVRQYRHGTESVTVEIPGGMVDEGEQPLAAAQRELREETGYAATAWELLGTVEPNPAFQTNRTYTYLAREARCVGPQQPDENEQLEVAEQPLAAVPGMLADGSITHALVFAAFTHLALAGGLKLA